MVDSRRSSRSPAGGNGTPYAACSRSHQPAPTPRNARPPESASSVAAAFAVMPAGRNVTGVHRVPSVRSVSSPATRPSVTHGSGIGCQAVSTCGIWIRWSIRAIPAKPAWSAASADVPHPRARVLAPGEPGELQHDPAALGRCRRLPCGRQPQVLVGWIVAVAGPHVGGRHSPVTTSTWSQPSAARASRTAATRRTWSARVGAGTGRSRRAFRRRHSSPGVSRTTATAGSRAPGPRRARHVPAVGVEAEGVDHGGEAAAEPGGDDPLEEVEGVGRGVEVGGPGADDAAQVVGGDDLGAAVVGGRPRGLARPCGADEDDDCGIGQGHDRIVAGGVSPRS